MGGDFRPIVIFNIDKDGNNINNLERILTYL